MEILSCQGLYIHYLNLMFFWRIRLEKKSLDVLSLVGMALLTTMVAVHVSAEEKIIQQEEISFDKCLNVITTSQNKLALAPEIENVSDKKRVAVFTLADGTLTITCDGEAGNVTVSTNSD